MYFNYVHIVTWMQHCLEEGKRCDTVTSNISSVIYSLYSDIPALNFCTYMIIHLDVYLPTIF